MALVSSTALSCARGLCGARLGRYSHRSKRSDSIVRGEPFCDVTCMSAEAAVRKQRRRREAGLDTETRRTRDFKRKYGITLADWEAMAVQQDHQCALCRTPFAEIFKVCVDHCHTTGRVRGLLCNECNHGLGKFHDDPAALRRAATYLEGGE